MPYCQLLPTCLEKGGFFVFFFSSLAFSHFMCWRRQLNKVSTVLCSISYAGLDSNYKILFLSFPAFSFIFLVVCIENNTCSELSLTSLLCSQNKHKIICSSRVCPRKAEKVCSSLSTLLLLKGSVANFSTLAVLQEAAPVSSGIKMSG